MPRFDPFPGLRYATADGRLDDLVAPPYDVVDAAGRADLAARNPCNAIVVEIPDSYEAAAELFAAWLDSGVLQRDPTAFYAYRMESTLGVFGALEVGAPDVLAHERTTPKDKADRLDLLRATGINTSPVWGLSTATGLSALLDVDRAPDATATAEGVDHELWVIDGAAQVTAISALVSGAPVLIADGHHRYEVATAYHQERPEADRVLCLMVELAPEQLTVRAIHRLVRNVGPDELLAALGRWFDVEPVDADPVELGPDLPRLGALALVPRDGVWLLRPTDAVVDAAEHDLDSSRLDVALAELAGADVTFQHGWDLASGAARSGSADAAVLLRPATVDQIAAISRGGERMPPKTTFFHPKPRTGMVFREVSPATDAG